MLTDTVIKLSSILITFCLYAVKQKPYEIHTQNFLKTNNHFHLNTGTFLIASDFNPLITNNCHLKTMEIADKLLWDIPISQREKIKKTLNKNPARFLEKNEALFVKALNSLSWYELISLLGPERLDELLTDDIINKIFPEKRRKYYKNARRLLSEYALSSSG